MAYDSGFSRRSGSERDLQPVAIMSVDPASRTAVGVTRTRHTVRINCAYATGDTITTPAVGEQWYCERFDNEWRLYGRIPFNDPTLSIEPEAGQVSVGSGTGPLELNGTEVRSNAPVFRLNGAYYRDTGTALERSVDRKTWKAIGAGGVAGLVTVIAEALASYQGSDEDAAKVALEEWAAVINEVAANFDLFWNLVCGNVFVSGLKRLGVGANDVEMIVDGFQNFVNYLFGIVFCDFTGDLTPQTLLAQLRDLLAPIVNNPFVQGLQAIAEVLGVAVGNLLNDAVNGLTTFLQLITSVVLCRFADVQAILGNAFPDDPLTGWLQGLSGVLGLFDADGPFTPAALFKVLYDFFSFLGLPEIDGVPNPVGIFFTGLSSFFLALTGQEGSGSVLQDAIQGGVGFVQLIFRVITCDPGVLDELAALVGGVEPGTGDPLGILAVINGLVTAVLENPLVLMVQNFLTALFPDLMDGTLIQQLLDGASNLVHLLIKVVTSILPFRELWETLLPFVDWAKVDEMEFALPDLTGFFLNGITDLWKMIFKPLDDLIKLIVPAAGETPFTDFIENIANFFAPVGAFFADPLAFLDDINLGLDGTIIPALLENVFKIVIVDPITGALQFVEDLVPAVGDFLANLFSLFGVDFNVPEGDFDPLTALTTVAGKILGGLTDNLFAIFGIDLTAEDLNPVTALTTIASKVIEGIFGIPGAIFENIITNLTNLFGGQAAFEGGSFNLVTAATYFVNNVLNQAATALQSLVEGVGSLVYNIAKAIIEVIGKIPLVGAPVAATLTALLEGFVNFGRGTVASGSNLLVDPGAEYASFWTQADATRDTAVKRSAGASLRVTSGGSTARTVWFNVNDLGEVVPILSGTGEVNYAECYVLYPTTYTVSGVPTANAGTSGTVTLVAQFTNSLGGASPASTEQTVTTFISGKNNTNWIKLGGNFTTPTPTTGFYDRVSFGFRLAANQTTSGARFYVDDMLVREISAATSAAGDAAAISTNLYGTASRPGTTTQVREAAIPTLSQGKVDGLPGVASTVGTLNTTVTGTGGLTTQVGTLNGQVSGSGGLIPKLYGGSTVGNQIQVTALPTKLQSVGSGVTLQRTTSNPNPYTTLKVANIMMPWGFYDTNYTSSDFSILNVSGTTMVRASNAGWYQVEMAFGLTRAFSNYPWYFNTILFKNSQPIKYGNGVANIPLTTALGAVYASYVPEVVQSSFIVYLEANEYLAPAYGWRPESGSPNSDTIIIANAPSGSTACITYFSVSLLNRSLA